MMRKIIVFIVILILSLSINILRKEYSWTKHHLIAHAAGGIEGNKYTNSKEAFLNSYENGYKLFEIDLSLTSDKRLVARHGWDKPFGQSFFRPSKVPEFNEFMNDPYYNKYTPMNFKMILDLLKEYPDIYVILDGKVKSPEDTKKLYEKVNDAVKDLDQSITNRIIPQMFYKEDVEIIRQYGFHDLLYVVGREDYTPESLVEFCMSNDINAVSLSKNRTNKSMIDKLSKHNIKIYMYTLNKKNTMKKYFEQGVNGFFTDFVTPEEFHS
ncbi:phosphatidylinositol-specific phospholipase C/glycerophosphodiester phosphodiesterase family protein [Lentibacillus salinarum]|uniref:Phosphatidylinositol-specific phospholipase C/glycerophosphodiester phosphodiesterase family protein n=1 Tax=Lentibacillus salinarum TaxID=446820 RepID=A0ABW3ZZV3_9BACI